MLSRIYNVHVRYSELFALRILLHNVKGPTCFEDVRTLDDGRVCKTFVEAARVRYLSSLTFKARTFRNAICSTIRRSGSGA